MKDGIKLQGKVKLVIRDKGKIVRVIVGPNLVTTAGKNAFTHLIAQDGSPPDPIDHVAFGTGGSTPTEAQTTLDTESGVLGRTVLTLSRTNNVLTYAATVSGGVSDVAVKEIGIFNAVAAGTMFARFLPQEFTFQSTMSVDISWVLTIG